MMKNIIMAVMMIVGMVYSGEKTYIPLMLGVEVHNPNYNNTPAIGGDFGTFGKLKIKDSLNLYLDAIIDLSFYHNDKPAQNSPTNYVLDNSGRCHGLDGRFVKSELCDDEENNIGISSAGNIEIILNFKEFLIGCGARINSNFMPYVKVGVTPPELRYFDFYLKASMGYIGAGVMITNKHLFSN